MKFFSILSVIVLVFFFLIQVKGESASKTLHSLDTHTITLVARKQKFTTWAAPEILQNGTLFYIAISISTLLWCTGKGVQMTIDQQERKANYLSTK
ncbi:hypothetical protein BJ944DRAFT_265981 [Cunninghamella echinulata]|nr:hypothetical protein BJ944DRAFT_265981 [Cunninghamella echinulata]